MESLSGKREKENTFLFFHSLYLFTDSFFLSLFPDFFLSNFPTHPYLLGMDSLHSANSLTHPQKTKTVSNVNNNKNTCVCRRVDPREGEVPIHLRRVGLDVLRTDGLLEAGFRPVFFSFFLSPLFLSSSFSLSL